MDAMYSADINSDVASLAVSITDTETTISVDDVSKLPTPPNLAVIGPDTNNPETILYESVDATNNNLTTVTRGFQGTAQSWSAEQEIARYFTAKDLLDVQELVTELQNQMKDVDRTFYKVTAPATSTTLGEVETEISSVMTLDEVETEIMSATTN